MEAQIDDLDLSPLSNNLLAVTEGPDDSGVVLNVLDEDPITGEAIVASQAFLSPAVYIYNVNCATGANTSFAPAVAINARWSVRLGYRSSTGVWTQSPIYTFPAPFTANTRYGRAFQGRLPGGTKLLQASWWYPNSGFYYYNNVAVNC